MTVFLDPVLETIIEETDTGIVVRAPRVGVYRRGPETGRLRAGGDTIGSLTVLNHTLTLVLPTHISGLVSDAGTTGTTTPVEYGQELFTLVPHNTTGAEKENKTELPEGAFAVTSPIDGVFYRSPSPGAPAFVEAGQEISTGQTIGLIEAMKSFNAVTYGGPGLPSTARIEEIKIADASETRQGALLLLVTAVSGSTR